MVPKAHMRTTRTLAGGKELTDEDDASEADVAPTPASPSLQQGTTISQPLTFRSVASFAT
eukprot:4335861-Amphidinium_carterae.2